MDSSLYQILPQLRHRNWAVGIATALETETIHLRGLGVRDKRLLGVDGGEGCVQRGAANRQTRGEHRRLEIGYMTGTGENLADKHMNRHMEAGGATLGFTVL